MAYDFADCPPDVPDVIKDSQGLPIVTFLSETRAADHGTAPDYPGPLGSFIGYTEISVLESTLDVLGRLGRTVVLVEKLHPAAESRIPPKFLPENVNFRSLRDCELAALLWHSDLVIGMRSMALLEAHILGCEAVSFQPGLIGPQLCTAVRLGLIPGFESWLDLESWCKKRLAFIDKPRERNVRQYPFAPSDAAERVIRLALENGRST